MAGLTNTYKYGRFIAHAGGIIGAHKYTNSVEAFESAAQSVGLIELDIVRALDGLIVAHDGMEKAYSIKTLFADVTMDEFRKKRFVGTYKPMALSDLIERLQNANVHVVLDLKSESIDQYSIDVGEVATLANLHKVRHKIIPQAYSKEDIDAAAAAGFENLMVALWKNHSNVRTDDCQSLIEYAFPKGSVKGTVDRPFRALSVAARHFWRDGENVATGLAQKMFSRSSMVFVHGQPEAAEADLMARGFGLFSHNAKTLAFGDTT